MQSVLIVDDEPMILDSAKIFLERFGNMVVHTAATAKQAFGILKDVSIDAIILDYYLPEIDGIAFLKILRTKGDTTPVIIFTGIGRENAAIEALNNGADFFLRKGETPNSEYRELVHMINMAAERRQIGRALGTTQKVLKETVNFFSEAAYAVDRDTRVIAWNKGMAALTGIEAHEILGKSEGAHAIPFFGTKATMLTELVLADDEEVTRKNYTILSRDEGAVCAWTSTKKDDGADRVLWMKATPLYDAKGVFIASIGTVRDISDDIGPDLLRQANAQRTKGASVGQEPEKPVSSQNRVLTKIMGQARASHREGLYMSHRMGNYSEAIAHFDTAIEIDPSHAASWHDRAVCLRELGKNSESLKSFLRAVELSPNTEEFLYSYADMHRRLGVLLGQKAYTESAVKAFNRVIEINPNNADAWNSMGNCMKDLGKDILSTLAYERAADLIRQNKAYKKFRNLDSLV
jgi:DNA-binding response OmpR family regulator